jgi:hypothetical protein
MGATAGFQLNARPVNAMILQLNLSKEPVQFTILQCDLFCEELEAGLMLRSKADVEAPKTDWPFPREKTAERQRLSNAHAPSIILGSDKTFRSFQKPILDWGEANTFNRLKPVVLFL